MKEKKTKKIRILSILIFIFVLSMSLPSAASAKTVARIGGRKYSSLQSAVNAVKKGQTIKLQCNVNLNRKSLILKKKFSYTIDLNRKTISNVKTINVKAGNVIIKNGTLKLSNSSKHLACTYLSSGTKLTLQSIKYTGSFQTAGTARLCIKNGSYRDTYLYNYGQKAIVSIEGGKFASLYFIANEGYMYLRKGTFNILGAEDSGFMMENGSENNSACLYVYGGEYTFHGDGILLEGGHLYVKPAYAHWIDNVEFMGGLFCRVTS